MAWMYGRPPKVSDPKLAHNKQQAEVTSTLRPLANLHRCVYLGVLSRVWKVVMGKETEACSSEQGHPTHAKVSNRETGDALTLKWWVAVYKDIQDINYIQLRVCLAFLGDLTVPPNRFRSFRPFLCLLKVLQMVLCEVVLVLHLIWILFFTFNLYLTGQVS